MARLPQLPRMVQLAQIAQLVRWPDWPAKWPFFRQAADEVVEDAQASSDPLTRWREIAAWNRGQIAPNTPPLCQISRAPRYSWLTGAATTIPRTPACRSG